MNNESCQFPPQFWTSIVKEGFQSSIAGFVKKTTHTHMVWFQTLVGCTKNEMKTEWFTDLENGAREAAVEIVDQFKKDVHLVPA